MRFATRIKDIKQTTKHLAIGERRTYYYFRSTMDRLPDDPRSPEFAAAMRAPTQITTLSDLASKDWYPCDGPG